MAFYHVIFFRASFKVEVAEKSRKIVKLSLENEKKTKNNQGSHPLVSLFLHINMKNNRAKFCVSNSRKL